MGVVCNRGLACGVNDTRGRLMFGELSAVRNLKLRVQSLGRWNCSSLRLKKMERKRRECPVETVLTWPIKDRVKAEKFGQRQKTGRTGA